MRDHLVSQVILRLWADHKNGPVGCLDLDTLVERTGPVRDLAYLDDLFVEGRAEAERVWQGVERRLDYALRCLDKGTLLQTPAAVATIKDAMALHWARGFVLATLIEHTEPYADKVTENLLKRFSPGVAMSASTGLVAPDEVAVPIVRSRIRQRFAAHLRNGEFPKEQFLDHFATAKSKVEPFGLELWTTSENAFIIGDVPVAAVDTDTGRVGVLNGVSWAEANAFFMPLGPRHVVALSRESRDIEAAPGSAVSLNRLQVMGSYREIYYWPGSQVGGAIAAALPESAAAGS